MPIIPLSMSLSLPLASFRTLIRDDRAMSQLAVLGILISTAVVLTISLALFMLTGA